MIEFLTLFLGLSIGSQTVELNVNGQVAEIEIQFDGETLTTLTAKPWSFECDLGLQPLPHDLVAIARDRKGNELDRVEQWINMGANRSRTSLAIQSDESGRPQALKLDWESIGETRPERIKVIFDGQPLDVSDPDNIPLPDHDGDEFHYVSASLQFNQHGENRRETDFGGARSLEISTELTAAVIQLDSRSLPAVAKMRSWFLKRGRPLAIHGVEKGGMELFVVRSPGAQEVLDLLARDVVKGSYSVNSGVLGAWNDWQPDEFFVGEPAEVVTRIEQGMQHLRPLQRFGFLDGEVRLSFVSPEPGALTPGLTSDMYLKSRPYSTSEGGLSWLFQQQKEPMRFTPRVGAAVALAGMTANSTNRRRAVLLITAGPVADGSDYSPAMTRDYLRALEVPLYVWSFDSGAADQVWGDVVDLGDPAKPGEASRRLAQATSRLRRDLLKQRVVWLKGRHLPNQITLSPEARGIQLAGSVGSIGPM